MTCVDMEDVDRFDRWLREIERGKRARERENIEQRDREKERAMENGKAEAKGEKEIL